MQDPSDALREASFNVKVHKETEAEEHEPHGRILRVSEKAHELLGPVQFHAWFLKTAQQCSKCGSENTEALFTTSGPTGGCLRSCLGEKWMYSHVEE